MTVTVGGTTPAPPLSAHKVSSAFEAGSLIVHIQSIRDLRQAFLHPARLNQSVGSVPSTPRLSRHSHVPRACGAAVASARRRRRPHTDCHE